ncbi:MAG: flavodoxin [Candidatus Bathyarchaeota archaeon]|nr:flavodoxin [Candidatus Bathyarchaeota archaeon]
MKTLVTYYSRTGTTKFVAETIAAELGADIEEIVDLKKRSGKIGWIIAGKESTQEKQADLAPTKLSPKDYDLIVLGTPIWAGKPTPAIRTYVAKNDLSGKKVALFFTADSIATAAVERTKALVTNVVLVGDVVLARPLVNRDETKKRIVEWCNSLKTVE